MITKTMTMAGVWLATFYVFRLGGNYGALLSHLMASSMFLILMPYILAPVWTEKTLSIFWETSGKMMFGGMIIQMIQALFAIVIILLWFHVGRPFQLNPGSNLSTLVSISDFISKKSFIMMLVLDVFLVYGVKLETEPQQG